MSYRSSTINISGGSPGTFTSLTVGQTSNPNGVRVAVNGDVVSGLPDAQNAAFRGFKFGKTDGVGDFGGSAMNLDSGEVRHTAGYAGYGGHHTWYANGNLKATLNDTGLYLSGTQNITANSASAALTITQSGAGPVLNLSGLPTSAAGLATGDIWNDSGTIKIV